MYAYHETYEDFLRDEMELRRQELIEKAELVVAPHLAIQFLQILSSAYDYECPVAKKIAYDMSLDQIDFYAIDEDVKGFGREFNEILEDRRVANYE